MIEAEAFTIGLTRVALAIRETVDSATFAVYHEAIGPETDAPEWESLTRDLAKNPPRGADGRPRFPSVVELLDALSEFRGVPSIDVEAVQAYERVIASSIYTAEAGATWTYRGVAAACGKVSAEAFIAAGGHHAFATTWDEAKRRARFIAEYVAGARERPRERLIGSGGVPLLTSGEERRDPTPEEARRLLGEIDSTLGNVLPLRGKRR